MPLCPPPLGEYDARAVGPAGAAYTAGAPAGAASGSGAVATGPAYTQGGARGGCGATHSRVMTTSGGLAALPAGAHLNREAGACGGKCGPAGCTPVCGAGGNCFLGEECGSGEGMMTFVGAGGGDYVTETTYRYVGDGLGDVRFIAQKRRTYFGLCCCIILLLALLALLSWLLWPIMRDHFKSKAVVLPAAKCVPPFDCATCDSKAPWEAGPSANCDRCREENEVFCCREKTCDNVCDGNEGSDECLRCRHEDAKNNCCGGKQFAELCTTTTTPVPVTTPRPKKTCLYWGDPHVITFDGARPSFYGDGDFWILKNPKVEIQGRYLGTQYTYGLAATNKVAISGQFINNHVIEIQPMENGGKILIDGREACHTIGSTCHVENLATIVHDDKGDLVDEAASQFDRHIVHVHLPLGITMEVFRWTNYVDLRIESPKLDGSVDGGCGNYNDDPDDDSTQAIFARIGARVTDQDLLFSDRAHVKPLTHAMEGMLNTCEEDKQTVARSWCQRNFGTDNPTESELHRCIFDMCFGMNEHALRTARTFATQEEKIAAGEA